MPKIDPPRRLGHPDAAEVELELGVIPEAQRERVVAYLNGAEALMAGGYWTDPVSGDSADSIPFALVTDGTFVWSSPWAFLVGRYGAALPDEFMEHMRALDFHPPELSEEVVHEIGVREGVIPSDDFWAELDALEADQDSDG